MMQKWLIRICFLLLIVQTVTEVSSARDSRETRRFYTEALRVYLVEVDRALHSAQTQALSSAQQAALLKSLEALSPKLSTANQAELRKNLDRVKSAQKDQAGTLLSRFRQSLLDIFHVITVPSLTPDLQLGATVYKQHCEACHGAKGDGQGKLAQNKRFPMLPSPSDVRGPARGSTSTPFSVYNLLLVGIEGTQMQAYDVSLSDQERWSVAFFLAGEPFHAGEAALWDPLKIWQDLSPLDQVKLKKIAGSLDVLAGSSDGELSVQIGEAFPEAKTERRAELLFILRRTLGFFTETPRSRS